MSSTRNDLHLLAVQRTLRSLLPFCLLTLLLALAIPNSALAQEVTGTILGTVTDTSGATVSGAVITITNTDRNAVERSLTTTSAGRFTVPLLPIGHYSIKVEAPGFKTFEKTDIILNVNDRLLQQIVLEIGAVSQTVAVQANALHVDTQSATASGLISGVQIRQLSLESRNYESFVSLMPGVVSNAGTDTSIGAIAPSGASNNTSFSLNGSFGSENNWTIDGVDNVDRGANGTNLDYPSVDAIAQVSVLRGNYNAEFGRSAGGQINVITRSGTSNFHGDLYEFFRNDALDANTWGNKAFSNPPVPRTPLRYNDFGGTIGGPIFIPGVYNKSRNRTFFFFSEEARRIIESSPTLSLVPNMQERGLDPATGNNPTFPFPVCLAAVNGDGSCPAGQSSTTIPRNLVNPAAAAYLKDVYSHIPMPQQAASDQLAANQSNTFNAHQEIVRVDHTFTPKISGFVRYLQDAIPTVQGGGLFNANAVPNVTTTSTTNPGKNFAASLNFIFSPLLLNQIVYGYSYDGLYSVNASQFAASNSPDVAAAIALPYPETLNRIPSLGFGAYLGSMYGFGTYADSNKNQMIFDNLTKIAGRHTLQFGVTYSHYEKSENSAGNNAGTFNFQANPDTTLANGLDPAAEWHQEFAYFLLGNSQQFTQLSQDLRAYIFQNQYELYAQDQFRLRPTLTLNFGVRYSNFRQPTDGKDRATSFMPSRYNPANTPVIDNSGNLCTPQTLPCDGTAAINPRYDPLNGIIIGGKTSPFGTAIAPQSNLGFQPRVSFAYDPTGQGRMSIRGGYGIFVENTAVGFVEDNVFANVPFVSSTTIFSAPFNNPKAGQAANNSPPFLTVTDPDWHQPYVQQFDLDFQQQLPSDVILDIGYYGSKGTHLVGAMDINEPYPGTYATSPLIQNNPNFIAEGNPQIDGNTENLLNLIRPYIGYGVIDMYRTVFTSHYNSLQASLQKQFTADSLINVNYTWSKNMTNASGQYNSEPQNSYDLRAEYGPALYDVRNVFNTDFVYHLPFFADQSGLDGRILGGWELSGIISASSGEYASAHTSNFNDPGGVGVFVASNAGKSVRPDQVSDPNAGAPHTASEWYNVNAFQDVPVNQYRVGDAKRNSIVGPGSWDVDLTGMKNFKVTETSQLQFRAEAYNVLNHTNYNSIDTTLGDGTTGQVIGAGQNRVLQLGLKLNF
jgi:outer membrane receptor protein involved in Fe transport